MFWGASACCQFFLPFSTNERVDDLAAANRCCRKGCKAIKLGTEIQYIKTKGACWFLLRLWCCWFDNDTSAGSFWSLLEFWHRSRWEFQNSSNFWSNVNGSTDSPSDNETGKNSLLKTIKISGLLWYGECWIAARVVWQSGLEGTFRFHLHTCPTLHFWELFAEHLMRTLSSIWNCCRSPIPSMEGGNYVSSMLDSSKHFLFFIFIIHQITSGKTIFLLNQLLSIKIAFWGGRVDSDTSGRTVIPSAENQCTRTAQLNSQHLVALVLERRSENKKLYTSPMARISETRNYFLLSLFEFCFRERIENWVFSPYGQIRNTHLLSSCSGAQQVNHRDHHQDQGKKNYLVHHDSSLPSASPEQTPRT